MLDYISVISSVYPTKATSVIYPFKKKIRNFNVDHEPEKLSPLAENGFSQRLIWRLVMLIILNKINKYNKCTRAVKCEVNEKMINFVHVM